MNLEKKLLTARFGAIDPLSIDDYIAYDGYAALKKALQMKPDEVIGEVKASGLKGRGGAGFPTGDKMESVRKAEGSPKFLICNADEGEPGNFKDRYLMEKDPHQLIEGMVISGYAVGSNKGYIFIRGEYQKSVETLKKAVIAAEAKGFLGKNILGSGFDFEIEVFEGAGSYICGEEFALMLCMENKPGRPAFKPPFPTTEGLFKKPTQINNVETFSAFPHILLGGGAEYAKIGTESSKGTKLVSLSGNVKNKGVFEVPYGVTIRQIIDVLGGGVPDGRKIRMVQLGGASGPCIPESKLDLKLDYSEMRNEGITFGSGAVIVMDERTDILTALKRMMEFFQHESCGKCTPCREGNPQMILLLDKFIGGTATENDLALMNLLMSTMKDTALCGLGQASTTAIATALKYFPDEFQSKMRTGAKAV